MLSASAKGKNNEPDGDDIRDDESVSDDEKLSPEEAAKLEMFMSPVPGAPDGVHQANVLQDMASNARLAASVGVAQMVITPTLWGPNVYKVLKQVHPDMGMSRKAMAVVSDIVNDFLRRMYPVMVQLAKASFRAHFEPADAVTAASLVLQGELAKHAKSEANHALTKAQAALSQDTNTTKRLDTGSFDGLVFAKRTIKRFLLTLAMSPPRFADGTVVCITAVTEYIVAEILELSGNAARDNRRARINPRHIQLAIRNDEELERLFRNSIISSGGVLPSIHAVLLPNKSGKR
ncbi:histone H2A [Thecamonas trahens ATCC 50062]|uniref:Histone H2A n=1 Tax=Thecamonas trahens ATCC 50062 TaxID=461836 RepID=A0A0L0D8U3_THETB|nr:histone H2A [Thecamonas trahens ATCC 50062]KNC48645.1 histone H2A [Thecamonas trahens ATCC 50062]|eukprot:XP_013762701.1 histone H2A [Thecamonas trahens ATCC 50062]